jgi:hypothetical protein
MTPAEPCKFRTPISRSHLHGASVKAIFQRGLCKLHKIQEGSFSILEDLHLCRQVQWPAQMPLALFRVIQHEGRPLRHSRRSHRFRHTDRSAATVAGQIRPAKQFINVCVFLLKRLKADSYTGSSWYLKTGVEHCARIRRAAIVAIKRDNTANNIVDNIVSSCVILFWDRISMLYSPKKSAFLLCEIKY